MSIFPLWWSSFSETLGRRTIYLVSFTFFLLWNVLAAVSDNIAMLIVMRILGGGAAASVQAVGAGTIADIWEVRERGRAMGIFYLGPLCGPLFAPIIGGALGQGLGWRSCLWFLAIYGGIILIFLFFALPEVGSYPFLVKQSLLMRLVDPQIHSIILIRCRHKPVLTTPLHLSHKLPGQRNSSEISRVYQVPKAPLPRSLTYSTLPTLSCRPYNGLLC